LEEQLSELEKDENSGVSSSLIDELREQIKSLKEQVEDLKKSLRAVLEGAKEYAQKLFS
jgi:archaellum component FlaC